MNSKIVVLVCFAVFIVVVFNSLKCQFFFILCFIVFVPTAVMNFMVRKSALFVISHAVAKVFSTIAPLIELFPNSCYGQLALGKIVNMQFNSSPHVATATTAKMTTSIKPQPIPFFSSSQKK